jgi:hypothetical protein
MPTNRPKVNITKADIDKIEKRLMHALNMDSIHIAVAASEGSLDKTKSESCRAYLKFIRDLKKEQKQAVEALSDEELMKKAQD